MDQKNYSADLKRQKKVGYFYLTLFTILIFAGIYVKRVLGHPEFMAMFHLPAAVFLVLGGQKVMAESKQRYKEQLKRFKSS